MTAVLARLAALQQRFGDVLRAPLERRSGTLLAIPERHDPALCARLASGVSVRSGLAVYNRRYWFRLFGVIHSEYRLFAALLGERTCSEIASRFFVAHPPRGVDLAAAGDGLRSFIERTVPERGIELVDTRQWVSRGALIEALDVDAAFQRIFVNGPQPPLRLSSAAVDRIATLRLVPSPAVALVDERWPLVALRRRLPRDPHARTPLPRPHGSPRTWALAAKARGVRALPLVPLNARLLRALATHPVGAAIAEVDATCSPAEAGLLASQAEIWLARSIDLGMWSRVEHAAP